MTPERMTREEMEKKVAEEFGGIENLLDHGEWEYAKQEMRRILLDSRMREEEWRGYLDAATQKLADQLLVLSDLRSQLAEAKGEREKELREAVSYGVRNALPAYTQSKDAMALHWELAEKIVASFLASRKEGG